MGGFRESGFFEIYRRKNINLLKKKIKTFINIEKDSRLRGNDIFCLKNYFFLVVRFNALSMRARASALLLPSVRCSLQIAA